MGFRLSVTRGPDVVAEAVFESEQEAHEAARVVRTVDQYVLTHVEVEIPPLCWWNPDMADRQLMRAMWNAVAPNKVAVIKFARSKSNAGLKEAKDWCDAHIGA